MYNYIISINNNYIISCTIPILTINLCDLLLIKLFGVKSRWFQLHSLINFIITIIVIEDSIKFFIKPHSAIKYNNMHLDSKFILFLHLYHIATFKLKKDEIFHHIFFVGFGVLPSIFYIKSNIIRIGYLACCGIPGVFEYALLSLSKHNIITNITQKKITSYIYCFIRQPLALYSVFINIMFYQYKLIGSENLLMCLYVNILLYINSCYYTHEICYNYGYNMCNRYKLDIM